MKWDVVNISGKVLRSVELSDEIYGVEMNEAVLHAVVKAYRANRRQGTHATKTRGYVSGGNKKPFKQKGTGGARAGSGRSPLNPGGAITHGPQPRDYSEKINAKVKKLALKVALSDKCRHNRVVIVDDWGGEKYSTKHVVSVLKNLKAPAKTLILDDRSDDMLYKSTSNLYGAHAVRSSELNAEQILNHEMLVLSEAALKNLAKRFEV